MAVGERVCDAIEPFSLSIETSRTQRRFRLRASCFASLAATETSHGRSRDGSRTVPSFAQTLGHAAWTASWASVTSPHTTKLTRAMSS